MITYLIVIHVTNLVLRIILRAFNMVQGSKDKSGLAHQDMYLL